MNKLVWVMVLALAVRPDVFTVTFTKHPDNAAILLQVRSDSNGLTYYSNSVYPITDELEAISIQRQRLPKGASYMIEVSLLRWMEIDGSEETVIVESASTIVHVP